MSSISLLQNNIRVSTPFIKVQIGNHIFGVYSDEDRKNFSKENKIYTDIGIKYPNYIQRLEVSKINGQVNEYSLQIIYPLTPDSDPNFFEKIFSQVSDSRKIIFSYGDLSAPNYLYKQEEAIITNITQSFNLDNASISYNVFAVSSSKLASSFACDFPEYREKKPSDQIKEILRNNSKYGLLDIYSGMRDLDLVNQKGLIASDDVAINIPAKRNISVLDYLQFLVNSMRPSLNSTSENRGIYVFKTVDDTSGEFGGPYFKIVNSKSSKDSLDTFELDIGYPSSNVVTSFTIDNNESYAILYKYSKKINSNEYIERIDDKGNKVAIYSPILYSNSDSGKMEDHDEIWWNNVTQYPISANLRIKGVLRPAILMSKVRLNVYFYGKLHSSSGLYIINKQKDSIGLDGCWTNLKLIRVGKAE